MDVSSVPIEENKNQWKPLRQAGHSDPLVLTFPLRPSTLVASARRDACTRVSSGTPAQRSLEHAAEPDSPPGSYGSRRGQSIRNVAPVLSL